MSYIFHGPPWFASLCIIPRHLSAPLPVFPQTDVKISKKILSVLVYIHNNHLLIFSRLANCIPNSLVYFI